jgi:2-polyprenyl-3-methyl-5-hydroxy-6-metoxy-1,4-benzoquinol methylase
MPPEETATYYEHPRPEVRALVPPSARHVVDVGCAAGALGAGLKVERPGIQVRGVEPSQQAATRARQVLDDVLVGSAEQQPPASWPAPDCVIFADVLEHLTDPWTVLRRWGQRLAPGGAVVASVPNVAHHSVALDLVLRGRWDYEDAGILDRTHLRFFTRESALRLFRNAGLEPTRLERVTRYGRTSRVTKLLDRTGGALRPGALLPRVNDPWTLQFLIVAT